MSHLVLYKSSVIFSICIEYVVLIELIFEAFYSESFELFVSLYCT